MGMRHAAVVAGLALGLMSGIAAAVASPITYDISGVASGTYGTKTFNDVGFDLQLSSDTSTVTGSPSLQQNTGTTYITVGSVITQYSLGDAFGFFVNQAFTNAGFYPTSGTSADALDVSSAIFAMYNLADTQPSTSVNLFFNGVQGVVVNGKVLNVTDVSDLTFAATATAISSVPLPSSAPMFGAALIALGAAGYGLKRKSKAAAQA